MTTTTTDTLSHLRQSLRAIDPAGDDYAKRFVDVLLNAAIIVEAGDVHAQPTAGGLWVRWRIDGVLQEVGKFPAGESSDVVARIKVLASLLTYRSDVAQEGRLLLEDDYARAQQTEMRLSTIPTLDGERAVVRLFAADQCLEQLDDLGLPGDIAADLKNLLAETSGAILVTGPAGSGKTTTCYAALRHLLQSTDPLVRRMEFHNTPSTAVG